MKKHSKKRANALLISVALLSMMALIATYYVDRTTLALRRSYQNSNDVRTSMLAEAGVQQELISLWNNFQVNQNFSAMDTSLTGAAVSSPAAAITGTVPGVGKYSTAVTSYTIPNVDGYTRYITVRSVGWVDTNGNGTPDAGEPIRTIQVSYAFSLSRSAVFDYTYFINNYGWMYGFTADQLVVNGDMRSNADFNFSNGSGTVNGSLVAAYNANLATPAKGLVNQSPNKWDIGAYQSFENTSYDGQRIRPAYTSSLLGTVGSSNFENWRDMVYSPSAFLDSNRYFGSVIQDYNGTNSWSYSGGNLVSTQFDSTPSAQLTMPDLSNFGSTSDAANSNGGQFAKSKAWTDTKSNFEDGTANPNYSGSTGTSAEFNTDGTPNVNYTGAYLDVWNSSTSSYQRVSSTGVVSSSVLLSGTSSHPIRVHGPVAVNGDVAMGGYITGQGTIYASRNINVASSLYYKNAPNFNGSTMSGIDQSTEHADMLGLAALGSVMMGDMTQMNSYDLQFEQPPFTQSRTDLNGNTIAAYDGTKVDSYGIMKYQSLLQFGSTASAYRSLASPGCNEIDAIMYTNNCGGGHVGTGGNGFIIDGSIISKDEAMVTYSLPMHMNYDNRIRERSLNSKPLIDIDVPRSPTLLKIGFQDLGFQTA